MGHKINLFAIVKSKNYCRRQRVVSTTTYKSVLGGSWKEEVPD